MSARILKRVSQIGRQNFAKISDLGLSTQTLKMVKMNPKLLVTRMEEEIPTPAIEMLQKQLIFKSIVFPFKLLIIKLWKM
jgi:hypothetical protein